MASHTSSSHQPLILYKNPGNNNNNPEWMPVVNNQYYHHPHYIANNNNSNDYWNYYANNNGSNNKVLITVQMIASVAKLQSFLSILFLVYGVMMFDGKNGSTGGLKNFYYDMIGTRHHGVK